MGSLAYDVAAARAVRQLLRNRPTNRRLNLELLVLLALNAGAWLLLFRLFA